MTFLSEPADSVSVRAKYDADLASYNFVMNLTHVWAHLPDAHTKLMELLALVGSPFSLRERGILIAATASTIGDSYCSYAELATLAPPEVAELVTWGRPLEGS
jgi:hypothetical protein